MMIFPPIVLWTLDSYRISEAELWRITSKWFFEDGINTILIMFSWPFLVSACFVSPLLESRWGSFRWMQWGIRCGIVGMFLPVILLFSDWWFDVSQMTSTPPDLGQGIILVGMIFLPFADALGALVGFIVGVVVVRVFWGSADP